MGDNVRVQCLANNLVRVEPKGPLGFEDGTTFMVTNRYMPRVDVRQEQGGKILKTDFYSVLLQGGKAPNGKPNFMVFNAKGETVYESAKDGSDHTKLFWPGPNEWKKATAVVDQPRFTVPYEWTVTPPAGPKGETNGYGFGNQVVGDTYVFVLGDGGPTAWTAGRTTFLSITSRISTQPPFIHFHNFKNYMKYCTIPFYCNNT